MSANPNLRPQLRKKMREHILRINNALDALACNINLQLYGFMTKDMHVTLFPDPIYAATNTLESIWKCILIGHMTDAFVLARKFRDDLLMYLFTLIVSSEEETRHADNLDNIRSDVTVNSDMLFEMLDEFMAELKDRKVDKREEAIIAWIKNLLDSNEFKTYRRNYFGAAKYLDCIRNNSATKQCYLEFFCDKMESARVVLDNYVHANGRQYILSNTYPHNSFNFADVCQQVIDILILIVSLFLSCIALIVPAALISSDYIDALEMGYTPEEGSQYIIDPNLQQFISKYFDNIHPNLRTYIRDHNPYGMVVE